MEITTNALLGDCQDVLKTLPDNSVDLIITSPPYADRVHFKLSRDSGSLGYEKSTRNQHDRRGVHRLSPSKIPRSATTQNATHLL